MKKLLFSLTILFLILCSCTAHHRRPASISDIDHITNFKYPVQKHQIPSNPNSEQRQEYKEKLEQLKQLLPEILAFRDNSIDEYIEIADKVEDGESLSGTDLERLYIRNVERDKIRKNLAVIMDEFRYAVIDYKMHAYKDFLEDLQEDDGWIFDQVRLFLAASVLLDDNFLLEATLYQENKKLRRILNEANTSYLLSDNTLFKSSQSFFSVDNMSTDIRAFKIYELVSDHSNSFLDKIIKQSKTYEFYKRKRGPNRFAEEAGLLIERMNQGRKAIADNIIKLRDFLVAKVSNGIGVTFMQIRWKDGALYKNRPVIEEMIATMKPLDVLTMKIRNKMTGRFVPGFWGHVALWLGTKQQLQELQVWNELPPEVQQQVERGNSLLDGGKEGVILTNLNGYYFNIDDVAVLRHRTLSKEELKKSVLRAVSQLGKEYDYRMDSESGKSLVCSEVAFVTYSMVDFKRGTFLGKTTAPPTEIAYEGTPGRSFKPVLIFIQGEKLEGDLEKHMLSLNDSGHIYVKRPGDLPEQINIKTPNETFTHRYEFALREGRIWFKTKPQADRSDRFKENRFAAPSSRWELLGPEGLPFDKKGKVFDEIEHIKEISADGDNLIAISNSNTVYYSKVYDYNWKQRWGMPLPAQLKLPAGYRSFGISHRGPHMQYYSDIDGNKHYVKAGVTTLYALDRNGHQIFYADPWLPPKFLHQVATPLNGRFVARKMSVSGSTLFLINDAGEMYTRLYDFDSAGENPVLAYSYERSYRKQANPLTDKTWVTRTLPAENWRNQPPVPEGTITDAITIFQTGEKGNAAFELRVEGTNTEGDSGYFYKKIYDDRWNFQVTHRPLVGKELSPDNSVELGPDKRQKYSGLFKRFFKREVIHTKLENFNVHGDKATLKFMVHDMVFENDFFVRRIGYKKNGQIKAKATLILSNDFINSDNDYIQKLHKDLFVNQRIINFHIKISDREIKAREALNIFGVDKFSDNIMNAVTKGERGGELKSKFHFPVKLFLTNYESDETRKKNYLSLLNFSTPTNKNLCENYGRSATSWIDGSPLENGREHLYVNIGNQNFIKMKVEFTRLDKELANINVHDISPANPITHKVVIHRPEYAPTDEADLQIYEKIFKCTFWGCKSKINGRLEYTGDGYRLYDKDGLKPKDQLDIQGHW